MKFRVTMKDPDAATDCIADAAKDFAAAIEGLDEDERLGLAETKRDKMHAFADQWLKYGEYVTIEFDTDAKTAVVVKEE